MQLLKELICRSLDIVKSLLSNINFTKYNTPGENITKTLRKAPRFIHKRDYFHKLTNKLAWDYDVVYDQTRRKPATLVVGVSN